MEVNRSITREGNKLGQYPQALHRLLWTCKVLKEEPRVMEILVWVEELKPPFLLHLVQPYILT
ncbi:MAG: hypothetical protein EBV59_10055 [Synechococcaceae bacterium WB7_1C_051]|nr:hypothetical protein [Synechococcaceae bacterium WB7_1C_051]